MKLTIAQLSIIIIAGAFLAVVEIFGAAGNIRLSTGPTIENALAADQELAKALQNNDSVPIWRLLDKDWAVITTHGGLYEGAGIFPSDIRTGHRTLTAMELSEPRVRLYGNTALVTTKVRLAGQLGGKTYDNIRERQTDVWLWKNGAWKCVLTQESNLEE
jgi:ketosteroid isomerase-like protein